MNVYDFDGTIYKGDSSIDFYLFILKRYPLILRRLPKFFIAVIKKKTGKCCTKEVKEYFFSFLNEIPDVRSEVELFWKINYKKLMNWYIEKKKSDDVIISASPYFLLCTPCRILNIKTLIATQVDVNTGKFISENCKGKEKVNRFQEKFPAEKIDKFYSDSKSDTPMAQLAEKAYIVKRGKLTDWRIK